MKEEICTAFNKNAFPENQNNAVRVKEAVTARYQSYSFLYLRWKILFIMNGLKVQNKKNILNISLFIHFKISVSFLLTLYFSMISRKMATFRSGYFIFLPVARLLWGMDTSGSYVSMTSLPLWSKNLAVDFVHPAACCCLVLPPTMVSFRVYLSLNLLRLEDSCRISESIPVGSFLWATRKVLCS